MVKLDEDKRRAIIFILGTLFILSFFLVNAQQYAFAFFIYLVLGVLSIFFYYFWDKIFKKSDLEGISKNWWKKGLIGLLFAAITIIITKFLGITAVIGYPTISASIVGEVGKFLVVVIFAPVFETVFLVVGITDFFNSGLKLNKYLSLVLMAICSSLFHLVAYGDIISNLGSFISACIMFFLFGLLVEKQNDIFGAVIWHAVLNWNIAYPLAIISTQILAII